MSDDTVDVFERDNFLSQLHESAHYHVGRFLGFQMHHIEIRNKAAFGGSAVHFSNVTSQASMIVCLYAGGEMEKLAGLNEYRIDGNDLKDIERIAKENGFQQHHLDMMRRSAARLCKMMLWEIATTAKAIGRRGIYEVEGDKLVYRGILQ